MSLFQYIKSNIAIGDLVGEYISLKPAGSYLKGNCPFHSEKTASFTVSPAKGIFYCFGCHEGGDVISFFSSMEQCSPIEAANELITRYNLQVPDELLIQKTSQLKSIKKEIQNVFTFFANWCSDQLKNSLGYDYVTKRGIKIDIFNGLIGYFPQKNLQFFLQEALNKGFLAEDFKKVGILMQGQTGIYSPFEERIIFPIKNHLGNIVACGGRIFKENDQRAKYYNSKEHEAFKKGDLVYGLDQAKKSIQKFGYVILVEGYLDCLMMWQAGYENTVATLGTACTIEQLALISRYTSNLYVMYDSDKAGIKAMLRLVGLCWKFALDLKVITLPVGVDPADFVFTNGNLQEVINDALDIYKYYILYNGTNYANKSFSEKLEQIQEIILTIEKVQDQLKRDLLIHEAAKAFDIPISILKKQTKNLSLSVKEEIIIEATEINYENIPGLQKRLIAILLHEPLLYDSVFELWAVGFKYPLDEIIFFISKINKENRNWQDAVWELNKKLIELIHRLALEYDHKDDILNFESIKQQFKRYYWKDIVKAFQQKIILAENSSNPDEVQKILAQFQKLKATF